MIVILAERNIFFTKFEISPDSGLTWKRDIVQGSVRRSLLSGKNFSVEIELTITINDI